MHPRILRCCAAIASGAVLLAAASTAAMASESVTQTPGRVLNLPSGYTGEGVRVGVLDSGIRVGLITHPCFADTGYPAQEQAGELAYTNNKVVVARHYGGDAKELYPAGPITGGLDAQALDMHGTHVAGIIACDEGVQTTLGTPMYSVAPQALLGSYNVFPGIAVDGVGPSDAMLARALTNATDDRMDVVNLSLGSIEASSKKLNRAIGNAWSHGVIMVAAAGNDGPYPESVSSPSDHPDVISVGSVDTGWGHAASIQVAGEQWPAWVGPGVSVNKDIEGTSMVLTGGKKRSKEGLPNPLRLGWGCTPKELSHVKGRVVVVARGQCPFSQKVNAGAKAGAKAVLVVNFFNQSLAPAYSGGRVIPAAVATLSAGRALKSHAGQLVHISSSTVWEIGGGGELSWFSSQGPSRSGLSKPDVLAPGGGVLSAAAGPECETQADCWQVESGTSMAAPQVSGVVALVRGAHPQWSASMVRSAVVHTAHMQPGLRVSEQGNGLVDASRAVNATLGLASLGVYLREGHGTGELLNPTDEDQHVSLRALPAAGSRHKGEWIVSEESVDVPAHGSATFQVSHTQGRKGDAAMLEVRSSTGESIHCVMSERG